MELNRLANQDLNLVPSFTYGDATGKVRHIRPEARWPTLEDNQVLHTLPHCFRPACLRTLFSVPRGTSTLAFPATVTVPGFVG